MYAGEDSEEETTEQETTGRSSGQASIRKTGQKVEPENVVATPKQPQIDPKQAQTAASVAPAAQVAPVDLAGAKVQTVRQATQEPKAQTRPSIETANSSQEVVHASRKVRKEPVQTTRQVPMLQQPLEVEGENFRVLESFLAEEPGDLDVQKEEVVKIIAVRPDGWWKARAADGSVGFVPKSVLEHLPHYQVPQQLEPPPPPLPQTEIPQILLTQPTPQPILPSQAIQGPIPFTISEQEPSREAKRVEMAQFRSNEHFSLTCHLTPRLSESNLGFHDIYWHYSNRDKVSNIHSIPMKTEVGGLTNFLSKITTPQERGKNFLVRSNYAQKEVVLRLELFHQNNTSLGVVEKVLLDDQGKVSLPNKTFTETTAFLNGNTSPSYFRLKFQVTEVTSDMLPHADSLPDVLICDEMYVQIFAMYRQLVAEALAEREVISKSTWICDPLIATFPRAAADLDLMSLFHHELSRKKALQNNDLKQFRFVYERYILPICDGAVLPQSAEAKRQYLEQFRTKVEADKDDPVAFMSAQKFRPITMREYALDLCGDHALD